MKSLEDDQSYRIEKSRRNKIYRQMLDEQIRYNNLIKQKYSSDDHQARYSNYDKNIEPNNDYPKNSYQAQDNYQYLPQIRSKIKENQQNQNDGEDTDNYLNNCEQIIKNLRELKKRKKRVTIQTEETRESPNRYQNNNPQYNNSGYIGSPSQPNYYPKITYFTSAGSAYNKNFSKNSVQIDRNKTNSSPILKKKNKIVQQYPSKSAIETPKYGLKNDKSMNDKLIKKSKKRKLNLQEEQLENKFQKNMTLDGQSTSPRGINNKKTNLPYKGTNFKQENENEDEKNKLEQQQLQNKKQKQLERLKRKERQEERHKKQLAQCIKQLTNYLKNQNKINKQQKQNEQQKSDNKPKSQQKNELQKSRNKSIKEEQSQEQQQEEKKQSPKQKQTEQKNEEKQVEKLKQKVLWKLKRLNLRSHQFLERLQGMGLNVKPKPANKRHSRVQAFGKSHASENEQEPLNKQLIQALMNTIQHQDGNNHQLIYCLKQLTQYLKNQNQQIEELKSSRNIPAEPIQTQRKSVIKKSKSKSKSKSKQKIQPKQQISDQENQQKLQQNILKRLKKARMRGSAFKQKMQSFMKKKSNKEPEADSNKKNKQKSNQPKLQQEQPTNT